MLNNLPPVTWLDYTGTAVTGAAFPGLALSFHAHRRLNILE